MSWQQQLDGSADTDRQELGYLGGFALGLGIYIMILQRQIGTKAASRI